MKKYTVEVHVDGYPTYEVEAENEDDAIDEARHRFSQNIIMWTYGEIISSEEVEDDD